MKYRFLPFLVFLLGYTGAFCQERGAAVTNTQPAATGKVFALIVGVSKYNEITSLKYADRDAQAFADFLKSKAGGSVNPGNIKIYTNEEATRANIFDELYFLKSQVQPGDLVYFYFAGHGDIEQDLSEGEDALLLLGKSFKKNYLSGSEFIELDKLRSYISNFAKKGVNVIFIADACHSGAMLSGGQSGKERTLQALQESWSTEIKLLSCQPNEVSEENQKWGGGRGIFSFTLEEGMKGLADTNGDSAVTLGELKRYMENEVPRQTGDAQNPDVRGDVKKKLLLVDMPTLLALKEEKQKALPQMVAMNTGRSAEDNLLVNASPQVKDYYNKFKIALDSGSLLEPKGKSAYDLYTLLNTSDAAPELKRIVKRNLVSALQDGAMIFIQNQLSGKKDVDSYNEKVEMEQMHQWETGILNLRTAINILGEDHYLTPSYKARQLYLEAYILYYKMTNQPKDYTNANLRSAIQKLDSAIKYEENASYAYYLLGDVYAYSGRNDSARAAYEKYLRFNPRDGYAYINLASLWGREKRQDKVDSLMAVALKTGSNQMDEFLEYVAGYYYNWDDYENARKYYRKAIELNPAMKGSYLTLGVIAKREKDYKTAAYNYLKVIELDSTYAWAYNNLANVYSAAGKNDSAILYYEKAIHFDPSYHTAISNLATQYETLKDYDRAYKLYHLSKSIEPYYASNYYGIGNVHYNRALYDSAEMYYYYATLLDSTDSRALYMLGKVYEQQKDPIQARLYYYSAADMDSTYASPWNGIGNLYYAEKRYEEAIGAYAMALVRDSTEPMYWNNLAKAYQYSDSVETALKIYRKKVLKLDSAYASAYNQIGNIFYERSEYDSALYYYRRTLHFDSTNSSAWYNMGLIADLNKDYAKSIDYYRKSMGYDSLYAKAYNSLGDAYVNANEPEKGMVQYLKYLQLDTAFNKDVLYQLGYYYYTHKDSAGAVQYFNRILQRTPHAASTYMLGALCQERGDYTGAEKFYKQLQTDSGYGTYALLQLGIIEQALGDYNQAKDYFFKAYAMDSANIYVLGQIGVLYGVYLKQPLQGRPYLQRAAEADSTNKNSSISALAYNYYLGGDTATAIDLYNKSLALKPDDLMSLYNLACLYSLNKDAARAINYFELSLKYGYNDFEHINADTDLDYIRGMKAFKDAMAKYVKKNN